MLCNPKSIFCLIKNSKKCLFLLQKDKNTFNEARTLTSNRELDYFNLLCFLLSLPCLLILTDFSCIPLATNGFSCG